MRVIFTFIAVAQAMDFVILLLGLEDSSLYGVLTLPNIYNLNFISSGVLLARRSPVAAGLCLGAGEGRAPCGSSTLATTLLGLKCKVECVGVDYQYVYNDVIQLLCILVVCVHWRPMKTVAEHKWFRVYTVQSFFLPHGGRGSNLECISALCIRDLVDRKLMVCVLG